ncbi:unnamed protein product [Mesocestoides corti]|uniref:Uncharacterized protein n=1 Tax=Mesocestoides corti TaxID=53468 RepID=A0A0R3U600_MESCO|nr:unnamed protein product [Mesocestoides corti]
MCAVQEPKSKTRCLEEAFVRSWRNHASLITCVKLNVGPLTLSGTQDRRLDEVLKTVAALTGWPFRFATVAHITKQIGRMTREEVSKTGLIRAGGSREDSSFNFFIGVVAAFTEDRKAHQSRRSTLPRPD